MPSQSGVSCPAAHRKNQRNTGAVTSCPFGSILFSLPSLNLQTSAPPMQRRHYTRPQPKQNHILAVPTFRQQKRPHCAAIRRGSAPRYFFRSIKMRWRRPKVLTIIRLSALNRASKLHKLCSPWPYSRMAVFRSMRPVSMADSNKHVFHTLSHQARAIARENSSISFSEYVS